MGHVTKRQTVAFVGSSIITDLPTRPPNLRFQFCLLFKCNVPNVILLVFHLSRGMLW